MQFVFKYLLPLSTCTAAVYLFYFFVLRPLTFYNYNRWYLLICTTLCFCFPFINIDFLMKWVKIENNEVVSAIPSFHFIASSVYTAGAMATDHSFLKSLFGIWPLVMVAGSAVLLARLIVQCISFIRLKQNALLLNDDTVKIYGVKKNIIPFAMGNSVFINIDLHKIQGLNEIICHESIHVKQKHTIDILLVELLCIVNWYNPFAWLLRHAIRQNLEFIADNIVLQTGADKKNYQYLLLKIIGTSPYAMAHQFNFSSLKKRITMMNKIKSTRLHLAKFLLTLPLIAVLLLAFRNEDNAARQPSYKTAVLKMDQLPLPVYDSLPPGVKSIHIQNSIATVKLKNGSVEKYDLNNEVENAQFIKSYGPLPTPPPPPPPPRARSTASAPVPPVIMPVPPVPPVAPVSTVAAAPAVTAIAPVAPVPPPPPPPAPQN